jgi:uncharacterized membrane protein
MTKARLEAFSDGVIAIIITIMVLELKVPHESTLKALLEVLPTFISYVLSFTFVAIYWVNHHHVLHTLHKVHSSVMWANNVILFFLSLIPFTTAWMGEHPLQTWPVVLYAINLLFCGFAYTLLVKAIFHRTKENAALKVALQKGFVKGNVSVALYSVALICAFWAPVISMILFFVVAVMWVIPDQRIEKALEDV